jgi:hypothetical protein
MDAKSYCTVILPAEVTIGNFIDISDDIHNSTFVHIINTMDMSITHSKVVSDAADYVINVKMSPYFISRRPDDTLFSFTSNLMVEHKNLYCSPPHINALLHVEVNPTANDVQSNDSHTDTDTGHVSTSDSLHATGSSVLPYVYVVTASSIYDDVFLDID